MNPKTHARRTAKRDGLRGRKSLPICHLASGWGNMEWGKHTQESLRARKSPNVDVVFFLVWMSLVRKFKKPPSLSLGRGLCYLFLVRDTGEIGLHFLSKFLNGLSRGFGGISLPADGH